MLAIDGLIARIDAEIERRSLLKHEFYRLWSEGRLTKDDLAGYSKEYYQLVRIVPNMISNIIGGSPSPHGFEENLGDEKSHVELWERFASTLGVLKDELHVYSGTEHTKAAVSNLEELTKRSFPESIAAMYSYEKEIPEISRAKVEGLKNYYGLDSKDSIDYFQVHEKDDIRHAKVWRNELAKVRGREQQEKAFRTAVESLQAQNKLLDSVMETRARYVPAEEE